MFVRKYRLMEEGGEGGEGAAGAEGGTGAEGGVENTFPENWREIMSGGDETILNRLSRYTDPSAVSGALIAAQNKISSGDLTTPFPADGSDEEKARWRADNNLPDAPEKYSIKLGEEAQDAEKEFLKNFQQAAFENNMAPEQAEATWNWMQQQREAEMQALKDYDAQLANETDNKLRNEWGTDYQANKNAIQGLLDTLPEAVKEGFMYGRLADGTPILSDPDAMKWLAATARDINPASTLVPSGAQGQAIDHVHDRIAEIENIMRTDRPAYNRDEKMQAELRDLYTARDKLQKRAS